MQTRQQLEDIFSLRVRPHSSILTELQYLIELVQIGGTNTFASLARFMSDCEYGKLPSYSFVEPLYRDFNVSCRSRMTSIPLGT
jgi:hypothetical protein